MRIGILGPVEVSGDEGDAIRVTGARLRRLLTRLALDVGRAVSVAGLVDAVWLDEPPADVANALQSLVSRLRRALGDAAPVLQSPAGYRLELGRDAVDANRFADLVAAGHRQLRAGDAGTALDKVTAALRLWRGIPLADADDAEYAAAPAARLDELRLAAQTDRAAALVALGQADGAIPDLEALVAAHPMREPLVGALMSALAATGRSADALAVYEAMRVRLADALGVDPGPELAAQHLALLRGELTGGPAQTAAPAGRRTNLGAAVSSFIGRQAELDRVAEVVTANRLVTIVGPGGAGKTRLASQAAAPFVEHRRDGVWLVELAPVTEEAAIASATLSALGFREAKLLDRPGEVRAATTATDRVLDVLADSDALLVVDNCEHLIGAVAEFVELVLVRCPAVRVLATSREPLGLPGETLLAIPPLGLPPVGAGAERAVRFPAVQLLAERGRAARADFAVTAENVTAVVDIVRRLDGLPLAIELAAARLRVLPVTEIAARLSDRFRLLAGGVRTAVARHRTLRAVVEWSWDLLSPAERLLAERLAVFPAGMTVDAAEQVVAGPVAADQVAAGRVAAEQGAAPGAAGPGVAERVAAETADAACTVGELDRDHVSDLLLALADKSLLQVIAGPTGVRYRMLETIREYGVERLDERGELAAARQRHAAYYAARAHVLSPVLRTRDQLGALAEFSAEYDNLIAALRYLGDSGAEQQMLTLTLDLYWYWNITSEETESAVWSEFALRATSSPSPKRLLVKANWLLGRMSRPEPDTPGGWQSLQDDFDRVARGLAEIDDGSDTVTRVLRMYIAFFAGQREMPDELLDLGLSSPDPWLRATTMGMRVFYLENNGDVDAMRSEIDRAYAAFTEIGDRWGLSSLLSVRAGLRSLDGDVDGAIADFELARTYLAELGSTGDDMLIELRMAGLRLRQGDLAAARRHIAAVRDGPGDTPVPLERALLGEAATIGLLLAEKRTADAAALAARIRARMPKGPAASPLYGHLMTLVGAVCAMAAVRVGDLATAREDLHSAYPAALSARDRPLMAAAAVSVADLARALGRGRDAAEILGAAAVLRGGDDAGDPSITEVRQDIVTAIGQAAFDAAYAAGRSLDKEAAARRFDPALLDDSVGPGGPDRGVT